MCACRYARDNTNNNNNVDDNNDDETCTLDTTAASALRASRVVWYTCDVSDDDDDTTHSAAVAVSATAADNALVTTPLHSRHAAHTAADAVAAVRETCAPVVYTARGDDDAAATATATATATAERRARRTTTRMQSTRRWPRSLGPLLTVITRRCDNNDDDDTHADVVDAYGRLTRSEAQSHQHVVTALRAALSRARDALAQAQHSATHALQEQTQQLRAQRDADLRAQRQSFCHALDQLRSEKAALAAQLETAQCATRMTRSSTSLSSADDDDDARHHCSAALATAHDGADGVAADAATALTTYSRSSSGSDGRPAAAADGEARWRRRLDEVDAYWRAQLRAATESHARTLTNVTAQRNELLSHVRQLTHAAEAMQQQLRALDEENRRLREEVAVARARVARSSSRAVRALQDDVRRRQDALCARGEVHNSSSDNNKDENSDVATTEALRAQLCAAQDEAHKATTALAHEQQHNSELVQLYGAQVALLHAQRRTRRDRVD